MGLPYTLEPYLDSFRISLESFRSFRGPLLLKAVTGQELFFTVSYSIQTIWTGQFSSLYKAVTVYGQSYNIHDFEPE